MNSFIAWIGGKRLLRKAIIERFPEEGFDRYIEVFGGAGWVLFGKEVGKELEVFNDADSNLINLYRCIKYHCEELQKELNWLLRFILMEWRLPAQYGRMTKPGGWWQ